ncbi:hypothetical protein L0F63_004759 [Massospora cicadina]|nr:hypothetical protein L0F63_004759 [Massospora cicadina]
MKFLTLVTSFIFVFGHEETLPTEQTKVATFRNDTLSENLACEYPTKITKKYEYKVSVGAHLFQGSRNCGLCMRIHNPRNGVNITAHIVDFCISCSEDALNADVKTLKPYRTAPEILLLIGNYGSSQDNAKLQVINGIEPTKTIEYRTDSDGWKVATFSSTGGYFMLKPGSSRILIKATSNSGSVIEQELMVRSNATVETTKQYGGAPGSHIEIPSTPPKPKEPSIYDPEPTSNTNQVLPLMFITILISSSLVIFDASSINFLFG